MRAAHIGIIALARSLVSLFRDIANGVDYRAQALRYGFTGGRAPEMQPPSSGKRTNKPAKTPTKTGRGLSGEVDLRQGVPQAAKDAVAAEKAAAQAAKSKALREGVASMAANASPLYRDSGPLDELAAGIGRGGTPTQQPSGQAPQQPEPRRGRLANRLSAARKPSSLMLMGPEASELQVTQSKLPTDFSPVREVNIGNQKGTFAVRSEDGQPGIHIGGKFEPIQHDNFNFMVQNPDVAAEFLRPDEFDSHDESTIEAPLPPPEARVVRGLPRPGKASATITKERAPALLGPLLGDIKIKTFEPRKAPPDLQIIGAQTVNTQSGEQLIFAVDPATGDVGTMEQGSDQFTPMNKRDFNQIIHELGRGPGFTRS